MRGRLFNFSGTGAPDPTMEPNLVKELQGICTQNSDGSTTTVVALDKSSRDSFDNHYFQNLVNGKGLLQSDQMLYSDDLASSTTKTIVQSYSKNPSLFFTEFANSMIKMGNVSPLTGSNGQVRINCRVVNS